MRKLVAALMAAAAILFGVAAVTGTVTGTVAAAETTANYFPYD